MKKIVIKLTKLFLGWETLSYGWGKNIKEVEK